MDVNECVVKVLESLGTDHVFGGSGQVNASMLLALSESELIKTVIVRNEQAASFMACGYSMFSDKLGVCFATGGPGAFNLFSGMAVALSDSLPILGITGYASKPDRGKGALNESSGLSRTPDSHAMFGATTKKSFIIESADQACDILDEAINLAYEGRPGPVHIHIPKNITNAEVTNYREVKLRTKPVEPDQTQINAAAAALDKALKGGRPVMALVGYGVIRSHGERAMVGLLEKYGIPAATTMDAKGVIPEDHPLSLGVYGTSGDPGAAAFFEKAELVLAVGNSFAQNATYGFRADLYGGKSLVHVNIDSHEIDKVYKADYPVVADARPALQALEKALAALGSVPLKAAAVRDKYADRDTGHKGKKIHPADLVKVISRHLPADSIVMGDAGSHMLWLNCYLNLTKNQRYQNPGSFGPMASHVNGSLGVKCAHPEKTVICGCGDGAYLMAGFELLTAVQYDIPVIWVIFNNGEFNVIKKFLINLYGKHAYMTFDNPDYELYAKACGAVGFRAETVEQAEKALEKGLKLNKPVIIDAHVEGDVYPPFALGKV
jgi:acetolactate synthase-1/2/3 large subunit